MDWQPIETATRNKVVLTDDGTGILVETYHGSDVWRWYLCNTGGYIPRCADYGCEVSEIEPTRWKKLPE